MQTLPIYSQYTGMEFDIEKCAQLIMKSEKRPITERIELQPRKSTRTLGEKENRKYLEILEVYTIKWEEMKEKIKGNLRFARIFPKTKLWRNLIEEVNIEAIPFVRYWEPFLKWTNEELSQIDLRTRKLMTVYKALTFEKWYADYMCQVKE